MKFSRELLAGLLLLVLTANVNAQKGGLDDLLDTAKKPAAKPTAPGGIDDLLEGKGGGIRFRLVPVTPSETPLAERLFWRTFLGTVAAEAVPAEFRIDDQVMMASQIDSEADAEGSATLLQATIGTAKLGTREQFLIPGKIPLKPQGGTFVANHPAIRNDSKTGEVQVVCAPVRFEFQDTAGRFVGTQMQIQCAGVSLLRKNPRITRMTMWLPVGLTYSTSLGNFGLAADGKLQLYGGLPPGVTRTELGFRKIVETENSRPRPAPPSDITVMSTDKPYSVFVANRLTPGEPLWLAVSRPGYMNSNGVPPLASHFAQVHLNKVVAKAEDCPPPGQEIVQRAAAGLNAKLDQLAWYRLPWQGERGANRVTIEARFGGTFQTQVLVAELARDMYLVPHRMRTVFANNETPVFHVILPLGHKGGEAMIFAAVQDSATPKPGNAYVLGKLPLPTVTSGFDSRSFEIKMSALPPGYYRIGLQQGRSVSQLVLCEVVPWNPFPGASQRSPFFVHSMIWGNKWPESDEGLKAIHDAGIEMLIQGQTLDSVVPQIDPTWQGVLDKPDTGPSELALQRTRNDTLLERLTRHQLKHVDFAVTRTAGFYNEGLSYHHSYQPSVDRMIQRLQIFTQQTIEYPSAAGVNFSWFPQMGGYVEGGVPTDAHTKDRNRTLDENLGKAGITAISREDRQWLQKNFASTNSGDQQRARELEEQDIRYWKAAFEFGVGKHNAIYAKAIREVNPFAIATLYENAGHDSGKRPDQLFDGMNATSYFTMTDYGDWPMSSAFTTEWSRAMSDGKRPVWLTTEFLNSTEGQTKQLFHAFARGLDGGGYQMTGDKSIAELNRRGKVLNFLAQYGAIAKYARPDRRVAILATNAKHRFAGNGSYEYHSLFYHLTRLGYPPAIIAEDSLVKAGIADETQVLALVNIDRPLADNVVHGIQEFQKRGGRVIVFGAPVPQIADAIQSGAAITSIWQGPGFKPDTHAWLWQQFGEGRERIAEGMKKAGLEPLASCDPAHGYALTLNGNKIDYVAVIADRQGTHVSEFGREAGLRVSVPCKEGYRVRDLRTQTDLEITRKDGTAYVSVDLVTEPATILAIFQQVPEKMEACPTFVPKLGGGFGIYFLDEIGNIDKTPPKIATGFANWPLAWEWIDPKGKPELRFDGFGKSVYFNTPLLGEAGDWKLRCQELVTGRCFEFKMEIEDSNSMQGFAAPISDVHIAKASHVAGFIRRNGERLVLLEPGQDALQNIAEDLVAKLNKEGVPARLWKLQPEDFDTQPNRWYPRPEDEARQALIDSGKLIGYREQMKAYIDKLKAVHVPERGGYATAGPNFMVGQDAIVFSGGRLAESLRSVTAWMETPNVPGKGQGRLVVVFSPFAAGKQVLAVVGNDPQGLKLAANEIIAQVRQSRKEPEGVVIDHDVTRETFKFDATRPVARPYDTLTPHRRVRELAANERGQAAVFLEDGGGVALVDEQGKVTAAVQDAELLATFDNQGQLWDVHQERTEKSVSITLRCIGPDGKLRFSLPAFSGNAVTPGINAGFVAAPDGKRVALGQLGKVLIGSPLESGWNAYDDIPHAQERFAVFFPRMPIAAVFSPDGRYLCLSLDTRPPLSNMSSPLFQPTFAETICIDTQTGRRVWSLRDRTPQRSTYAVYRGFLAVARDAKRVALIDYDGGLFLVDEAGKELVARRPDKVDRTSSSRLSPAEGVSVSIADDGSLAVFGFKQRLVLAAEKNVVDVPLPGVSSVCVTRSGSHVVAATEDGAIVAIEPSGSIRWTKDLGTVGLHVAAATGDNVFVGTGNGELLLVDGRGEVVRRTAVFETAKKMAQTAETTESTRQLAEPKIYSPPDTLGVAKRRLKAKQVASWQPAGATSESFGQKFYRVDGPIQLNAGDTASGFLHLVYRRPTESKSLKVTITGSDSRETFDLDLPTPTYRVVDLPLRGPKAQISIEPTGPVEIAECSLWSMTWTSDDLALVRPSSPGEKKPKAVASSDDLLADLTTGGVSNDISGRMKDCKIWWPNTDPDRVKGHFLSAPVDPLTMVDGVRFGGGKSQPWASGKSAIWGGSMTIDFGKPVELSLVATYDRVTKQSAVNSGLMVFSGGIKTEFDNPPPLAAINENDQFWRVFEFAPTKVQILGTHVFAGDAASGLSEVEAYR